jgi:hypothetical protein
MHHNTSQLSALINDAQVINITIGNQILALCHAGLTQAVQQLLLQYPHGQYTLLLAEHDWQLHYCALPQLHWQEAPISNAIIPEAYFKLQHVINVANNIPLINADSMDAYIPCAICKQAQLYALLKRVAAPLLLATI